MLACIWIDTPPSELNEGNICHKWNEESFTTPLNDANNEVLQRCQLNYDLNVDDYLLSLYELIW
jgi:hypothetical protein